jgi:hypothetical protein
MAPPLPTVAQQGQGAVSSDQLNTYVQVVQNFAQLRTFTALNDMCVSVLGGASEGDGNQGIFWYDSTSTATDNGSTVIVPTGASGAWLLLPPGSNSPGNFASLTVSGNGTFGSNLSVGGTLSVTGVATFAADILMTGTGEIQLPVGTTAQRSGVPALGMQRYNSTLSQFEGYGASGWQSVAGTGIANPPSGRLTLSSGVPVLSAAMIAAVGVIYTPYLGNTIPQWNGTAWVSTTFAEISQALSDTTNSPAAAVASGLYDLFVWFKAGAATLSRGPAWTNGTTRSLSLTRTLGFLTNSTLITNGPAAGYGLYVGTIACDASGATVTFNPTPAAASGGPSGGAVIGVWNTFNRVSVAALVQDSKASWTYATASWRSSDGSTNNRVTNIVGQSDDSISASFNDAMGAGAIQALGIGVNSTTAPSGQPQIIAQGLGGAANGAPAQLTAQLPIGQNYLQALEFGSTFTTTFYGAASGVQTHGLSALLRY